MLWGSPMIETPPGTIGPLTARTVGSTTYGSLQLFPRRSIPINLAPHSEVECLEMSVALQTEQPIYGAGRLIEAEDLSERFNNRSFQFNHNLAGNPLFSLPRLEQLAKRLLEDRTRRNVRWQSSDSPVDAGWNVPTKTELESLDQAIAGLGDSNSWILLYSVQRDPEYRSLLDDLMAEIISLTGVRAESITWQDAYIFMASPHSVTPYHIDHEATFLFQIHGAREANIWSAKDTAILPDREIERYYMGDLNAAVYKAERHNSADFYDLRSGTGVHHPSRAAHSFRNGGEYSIALGVHFCMRDIDREAAIYQVNSLLRMAGLEPTPPGQSAWRDSLKASLINAFAKRNPKDKNELLRSGIRRLAWPGFAARNIVKLWR